MNWFLDLVVTMSSPLVAQADYMLGFALVLADGICYNIKVCNVFGMRI